MQKKLLIKNQKICYIEKNDSKTKTIFFLHGNSGSAQSWSKQLSHPILSEYRLIAFDLPAHGNSDAFKNYEDYNLRSLACYMSEAVQACSGNDDYMIIGFSLGTNILAEMLALNINPKGIVLISPCIVGQNHPLQKIGLPGFDANVLFADNCADAALLNYINLACHTADEAEINLLVQDYKRVKPPFRSMILQTALDGKLSDEIDLLHRNVSGPILVVFGKDDQVVNPNYLDNAMLPFWNNIIYKIDEASHYVHRDQPGKVNKLIEKYCRDFFS